MWMTHGYRYIDTPRLDIFGIILFVLFVILVIWMIKQIIEPRAAYADEEELEEMDTALEILKKRYAKGELSRRQYLEMRKDVLD